MNMFQTVLVIVLLVQLCHAHSWVECTDYKGEITSNDFDSSKCAGFARDWPTFGGNFFGLDRGYDYIANTQACKTKYNRDTSYSGQFPMATYTQGDTVRVVWPAKNHVADTCTNPYIPDTAMKLFVVCDGDVSTDPDRDTFTSSENLVIDWKEEGNRKGFQNCPDFCGNMDKAVCFQDFTVPTNLPAGQTCTFLWYWTFNPGQTYTTCWEAQIMAGGSGSDPTNSPTNQPTPQPTNRPTPSPTLQPTPSPTNRPTNSQTNQPTNQPTNRPTNPPSNVPSDSPALSESCTLSRQFIPVDMVKLFAYPRVVKPSDSIIVEVAYSSRIETAEKVIVVQLRDSNFQVVGSAATAVESLDSACIAILEIQVSSSVAAGENLDLEAWIVNERMYAHGGNDAWKYALDRAQASDISAGTSTQY